MMISVTVKPGSRHPGVLAEGDTLVVRTRARAIENAANAECILLLSKHYAVAPSRITLLHGTTSRHKLFQIS